ncbi:MAG: LCP family protein [Propionibacteriaceae bacterium]|jgi:LCP family protein required for cell wall assembly|nr:LCP family protein [Propionibacteriaceae bacterium]
MSARRAEFNDYADETTDLETGAGDGDQPGRSYLRATIAALIVVLALTTVILVAVTKLLPAPILVIAIIVDLGLAAGLAYMVVKSDRKTHPGRFFVAIGLSVLLAVANIGVVKFSADFLSLARGLQPTGIETMVYNIVVNDDGPSEVAQLFGTTMAEVKDDPYAEAVHAAVVKLLARTNPNVVTFVARDSWREALAALETKEVTSTVLPEIFVQLLEDADPAAFDRLRVLASFEIELTKTTPKSTPTPTPPLAPKDSYVIYISGIDTYGSIAARARSDVNILMVVNPATGKVLLVNTPRDFYVPFRGLSGLNDKLTHAGVYGIDVSLGTLEDLYETSINYYLRINFTSLVVIVNALGGVDVNSVHAFHSQGYYFHEGINHLDGAAALAFARERKSFAGGDRVRGENQQLVIEAIIKKAASPAILSGYGQIMATIQDEMQTSMPPETIAAQVRNQLAGGPNWVVTSISVNGFDASEFTYTYPGQRLYVMRPDPATVTAAIEQIKATLEGA